MKVSIRILLTFLTILTTATFISAMGKINVKTCTSSRNDTAVYEVAIRRYKYCNNDKPRWAGVILTPRFVLTVQEGFFHDHGEFLQHLSLFHIHVGEIPAGDIKYRASVHKQVYGIDNIWLIGPFALLRTSTPIVFNYQVRSIDLPKEDDIKSWTNPCNIPNNEEFYTSFWCKMSNEDMFYFFRDIKKCRKGECHPEHPDLFSSCMTIKNPGSQCYLIQGAPLEYRNTLIGLRKSAKKFDPNQVIVSDIFFNVAKYTKIIQQLISGEIKCHEFWF